MTRRKWVILVIVLGCIIIGAIFLHHQLVASVHTASSITDLSETYKADQEIKDATQKLAANPLPARVIRQSNGSHQVALVFDGLPDRATVARLLDVLKKYDAKAVFFVEGQNAANQPETIKLIRDAGMEIGNYTFIGIAHADTIGDTALIEQLCRTQKIVTAMTDKTPSLLRAPKTTYTPDFLRVAGACGIEAVVQSTFTLPKLHTISEADVFAATVKDGSIIAIPSGIPVEIKTMKQGKSDERPAFDKKPTIKDNNTATAESKDNLVDITERLLISLQRLNYVVGAID